MEFRLYSHLTKKTRNMKTIQSLICLMLVPVMLVFAEEQKKYTPEMKSVTVFLSGAQLNTESTVNIPAGTGKIIFEGLSADLDENSLQARGEGDFVILSVVRTINFLKNDDDKLPREIRAMKDSLENINLRIEYQQSLKKVYEQEMAFIKGNTDLGGKNAAISVTELEKLTDFFRRRMSDIEQKNLDTDRKLKKLREQFSKVKKQLDEMNAKRRTRTSEVTIETYSRLAVQGKILLTYFVNQAGWTPYYDLRANDVKAPVKLEYRARVWNGTGEEWDKVKLSLSTGNPSIGGTQPVVNTWFINVVSPVAVNQYNKRRAKYGAIDAPQSMTAAPSAIEQRGERDMEMRGAVNDAPPVEAATAADYTVVNESQTNYTFEIKIPYTIPSDRKPYIVAVQDFTVNATYRYFAAPRLDKDAFLIARLTGWDQLNLLSGDANVFYEGMFVGTSYIDAQSTDDTLEVSLGRDKSVVLDRVRLKDFSEKKTLGSTRKETHGFDIEIRNKKKSEIELYIEDQVPVSQNKELEIVLEESSGGKKNEENGKVSWNLKVTAGETKKLRFVYSLKYPKDKILTGH
jgi:uncharacterized protein (TIGR02231 family)